ncbi:hypothetical protein T8K17_13755 [Thalassobaculum sp. OXR-137]|uniref:hypothetical protein n=1 Tax=Thalassobaculum sp. OXR-137 TaxID=3100173 RepID=UPI002AC981AC|nr:hypothetical protein [Thalassobaculum sp. OXR-137]WPZ32305.1 hypothetical protein T8K17_13755 [Thalassobaculum sp. OXR-137]
MDRFFIPIFSAGFIAGALIMALLDITVDGSWISENQTISAGLLALLGALLTVIIIVFKDFREFSDRKDRIRADIRFSLSAFLDYCEDSLRYTKCLNENSNNDDAMNSEVLPEQIHERHISALSEAATVVNSHEKAYFQKALLQYQVLDARLRGVKKTLEKNVSGGNVLGVISEYNLINYGVNALQLRDTVEQIYGLLNEQMPFSFGGRREELEARVRHEWDFL